MDADVMTEELMPVHEYSVPQQPWDVPSGAWRTTIHLPFRYPVVIRSAGGECITVELRNSEGVGTVAVIDVDTVDVFASALKAAAAQSRIVHMLANPTEDGPEVPTS